MGRTPAHGRPSDPVMKLQFLAAAVSSQCVYVFRAAEKSPEVTPSPPRGQSCVKAQRRG